MKLHHLRGRVIGGKCLDRRDTRDGMAVWVVRGSAAGTTTTTGTSPTLRAPRGRMRTAHATRYKNRLVVVPPSPHSPADCPHLDVAETLTHDGYVNRTCRQCGQDLQCRRADV